MATKKRVSVEPLRAWHETAVTWSRIFVGAAASAGAAAKVPAARAIVPAMMARRVRENGCMVVPFGLFAYGGGSPRPVTVVAMRSPWQQNPVPSSARATDTPLGGGGPLIHLG